MNARRGRPPIDRRVGFSVELPLFGVGLSVVSEASVIININNSMPHGRADRIVCVPVAKPADSPNHRLYRGHLEEDHERSPRPADIRNTIQFVITRATAKWGAKSAYDINQRTREQFDDSLRERIPYERIDVPRAWWPELPKDASAGLLFLMLFGVYEDTEQEDSALATAIARRLDLLNVSRCVVPSRAIRRVVGGTNAPRQVSEELCFVLASCHYPAGLADGTPPIDDLLPLVPGPADQALYRLTQRLEPAESRPELVLLAGDQVYVDATAGLFDPSAVDGRFIRPYEQRYSNAYIQHVTRQTHVVSMLDDHEIIDNFESETEPDFKLSQQKGVQAYIDYQRRGSLLGEPGDVSVLWAELTFHPYRFFVADTRTGRTKRTAAKLLDCRIMAQQQWAALSHFLCSDKQDKRPRFVVSPSVLLPRRLSTVGSDPPSGQSDPTNALHSDAWDGFPASFNEIFQLIAREKIHNVVFLSGDEHRCCWSQAKLDGPDKIVVISIHSSALYAPYVFANSIEDDFVQNETLKIPASAATPETSWEVTSMFAPKGEGFAQLRVLPTAEAWALRVDFDLDHGASMSKEFSLPR